MKRLPILWFIFAGLVAATGAQALTLTERDRDRLKKETIHAIDLLQRYHYKQTPFQEIDSGALLRLYMEDLDGSKLFLTQEDIDFVLARFESSLKPSYLFIGDLFPAFEIFNLYQTRVHERLAWVQRRLVEPFDLETERSFNADRRKADWIADAAAADQLWENRLTHELILELLEDEPMERAIATLTRRYERMGRFVDEIEIHNVQETFLTSIARMYDPHSNFFSWDSAQEFEIQISNALVGIGAQLRDVDGYCVIERLMPGGPAEMSGRLHPGDKIVAVGQGSSEPVDVVGMKLRRIVQMIRGPEGSEVRLMILPANSATREEVILVRQRVELTANLARAELFELPEEDGGQTRIGVIELPSFYGEGGLDEGNNSTSRDVAELIELLRNYDIEGLILDLRNNGGGRLDEAIALTGLFVPSGPVVMKRSFDGRIEEDWDRSNRTVWDGPLAILVSRNSASASEIVAGALQSMNRALIIGDPSTHGKGTVQAPISLRNSMRSLPFSRSMNVGTVKVTVQQFFLPDGASTQNRGVLADIVLPSTAVIHSEGEADLPNALAWDQIQPIQFQLKQDPERPLAIVGQELIRTLSERSAMRRAELPEFDFLERHIAWLRERRDRTEVSLNLEQRRAERELLQQTRNAFDNERNELSRELGFKARSINLAITDERERAHQRKLLDNPLPNGRPRANQFYQKVFYYQAPESEKLHEIWVEFFDYDKALQSASEYAQLMRAYLPDLTDEQMTDVLTRLRNRDRDGNFDVVAPFREVIAGVDEAAVEAALPALFTRMVEADPDILLDRPKLDVQLREALRIVKDWVTWTDADVRGIPATAKVDDGGLGG